MANSAAGRCRAGPREPRAGSLKATRRGLNYCRGETVPIWRRFAGGARNTRKVLLTMIRMLSALLVMGAAAGIAPLGIASWPQPVMAAAPIPEVGGTVPSLAPMLSRITPGVVNIAVRG